MWAAAEASVSAPRGLSALWPGAKLGAIRPGLVWTAVGAGGIETLSFRLVWTAMDGRGRRLEIYGSGGWGFKSLRVYERNPVWPGVLSLGGS